MCKAPSCLTYPCIVLWGTPTRKYIQVCLGRLARVIFFVLFSSFFFFFFFFVFFLFLAVASQS